MPKNKLQTRANPQTKDEASAASRMNKYKYKFESGTLKQSEWLRLSNADQVLYLDQELRRKYGGGDPAKLIGERYDCTTCAKMNVFELDGTITEDG